VLVLSPVGVGVNDDALRRAAQEVDAQLQSLDEQSKGYCTLQEGGGDVSLTSPRQVGHLLFDVLKLDTGKSRRMQTGWSTDQKVLEALKVGHAAVPACTEGAKGVPGTSSLPHGSAGHSA
jgi:DNA polymerase I